MENVKMLETRLDKELKEEANRAYYGIFLLLIVYGSLFISCLYWMAENDKILTK